MEKHQVLQKSRFHSVGAVPHLPLFLYLYTLVLLLFYFSFITLTLHLFVTHAGNTLGQSWDAEVSRNSLYHLEFTFQ